MKSPWKIGLLLWSSFLAHAAAAGISFDGSMGPAATLTGPNYIIAAKMGTQVGGNLFHSFGQFNLLNGETADFTATGSTGPISNIIARVTGGNASSIDGTIESSIAGANLFLLNSSGVMFGPHAQVDVTGAFTVGTPDYIKMADGIGKFSTSLGGSDVLTSAPVSAFGFLTSTPQAVQFASSNLTFATGSSFTVIAGAITLDGATITAPAANVSLFSANASGAVAFNQANPGAGFNTSTMGSFGTVTLQNTSKLAIDSLQGGGSVVIRAGQLVMQTTSSISSIDSGNNAGGSIGITSGSVSLATGSIITTQAMAGGAGGNISVASTGAVSLQSGGQVLTSTRSAGAAGNIQAQAQSIAIDGGANPTDTSGVFSQSFSGAAGVGGDITLSLSGALSITDRGSIAANAFGLANGGSIFVQAQSVSVDGSAAPTSLTGIISDSEAGSTGNGGNITLQLSEGLSLLAAGTIAADTFSAGNAGDISVTQASSVTINGSTALGHFTGISSSSNQGASGKGGDVSVTSAGAVSVQNGGAVVADTFSSGNAGKVVIKAGTLTINGAEALADFTGIASDSDTGATGNGGSIALSVGGNISILGAGTIAADTFSPGNAGDITVRQAGSLTIDGSAAIGHFTGITSASDTGATGRGGSIHLDVTNGISIAAGGAIVADTYSSGGAGEINLQAGSMTINGSFDPAALTGIASSADPQSTNNGGAVVVTITNNLTCTGGGGIDSQAFSTGHGGEVSVTVGGNVNLTDGGYIDADAYSSGNGGTVGLTAQSIFINGAGPAGVGFPTGIDSDSMSYYNPDATGSGGDVNVTALKSLVIIHGGTIAALTQTLGNGGNVVVNAPGDVTLTGAGSGINSSSSSRGTSTQSAGTAGSVTLEVGTLQLNDLSSIATSAVGADAGAIDIRAGNKVSLFSGSSITTSAGANGGNINLQVAQMVYLLNGSITATAGTLKKVGVTGKGGDITIDPQYVVLNDSLISANAAIGKGGDIDIVTNDYLNSGSLLTATGSTDGTITISAPDLDLSGDLLALPASLVSDENRLRESCARAINHEFSSLIVVGRGGTESAPEELQPDFGMITPSLLTPIKKASP